MYPNLLASSLDPAASMTAANSASSPLTLKIMLGVVLVFLPVVIAYQVWVYVKFRDVVTAKSIRGVFFLRGFRAARTPRTRARARRSRPAHPSG